jgi:glycosyltransferase involved in cell wall biosynthesis
MTPLNVAIYEPYPMGEGGNFRTLVYILKFLDRTRFTPIIVVPQDSKALDTFRNEGIEVIVATPPASVHRFAGQVLRDRLLARVRNVFDLFRYNLRLARFMRARRIDLLYCNSIRALLLAGIGARIAGVPSLWYVKGELANGLLDRIGFRLANRILFFCAANRDDKYPALVRKFSRKIGILRIGIDPEVLRQVEQTDTSALRRELDIREDRINAVILAQLYPPKGQHLVLERLREIVNAVPQLRLYLVGDPVLKEYDSYRRELEQMVDAAGLRDHVVFTGWRSDALPILTTMDFLIHPSLAEGFGRAVLEAMALGLPVVASAVGGLREIIRDGENGFLVTPGDSATLADRIIRLARERELRERFGREARREVYANYLIADKMLELQNIWAGMVRRRRA